MGGDEVTLQDVTIRLADLNNLTFELLCATLWEAGRGGNQRWLHTDPNNRQTFRAQVSELIQEQGE